MSLSFLMSVLNMLSQLISILVVVFLLYQAIIGVFALLGLPKAAVADRRNRFAIVVAARNEQRVIGNLLDSLNRQNYPRDAFSVFVIADNCTDNTAQVSQARGARVYCRRDAVRVGKGYALNWFFELFRAAYPNDFDAVVIFDADNLADPDFLAAMNDRLCAGECAVMGYRDSKNPYDSWVAAGHSISFWFNSRFYLQPRARLGLSTLAGGTGYAFRTELIADGWQTGTISEDLEFSLQLMARGGRVGYEPRARFYDEQPVGLFVSMRQRIRWANGCYQNIRQTLPYFFRKVTFQTLPYLLDSIIFLFTMPFISIQMLSILPQFLTIYLQPVALRQGQLMSLLASGAFGLAVIYLQVFLTLLPEKKLTPHILVGALLFPVFLMTNSLAYLIALVKPNLTWQPIVHRKSVSLDQIDRS